MNALNTSLSTPETTLALLNASQHENAAKATKNARTLEEFEATAQEFEALFVTEMVKPMFEGLETGGTFGGGKGEEIFRGFLVEEYGKLIAETGAVGMKDSIKLQLIKLQETADAAQ